MDTACVEVIITAEHSSILSAGEEPDGGGHRYYLRTKGSSYRLGLLLCRCKNKGEKKTLGSWPAEPRSLLTQPLMDVGIKAKDRKAALPETVFLKKKPTKKNPQKTSAPKAAFTIPTTTQQEKKYMK